MTRYLVRVEVPATWTIEIHAEDEDAANIAARELLGEVVNHPSGLVVGSPGGPVIDWTEGEWTLEEVER